MNRSFPLLGLLGLLLLPVVALAGPHPDVQQLSRSLAPLLDCCSEKNDTFAVKVNIDIPMGAANESLAIQLDQVGADTMVLEVKHNAYWVKFERRPDCSALLLPLHKTAFVGTGSVSGSDIMAPKGLLHRLVGQESLAGLYLPLVTGGDPQIIALMLTSLVNPAFDEATSTWSHKGEYFLRFEEDGKSASFECSKIKVRLRLDDTTLRTNSTICLDGYQVTQIERAELERQLARGIRRALGVLAPSPLLTNPSKENRHVAAGQLRWIGNERVVLLRGTPEQIGTAHAALLKDEIQRCIDSVLYAFGTFQTIRSGRWFRHDLQSAYERLSPYIPQRHKAETLALAKALNIDPKLAQAINVFPELFHCSGFALLGKATQDGKLYHGRVLDYMTTIGLQDSATTFVIAPQHTNPFVTVGYAGFIGSVSGMNNQKISLGEMGGRGEGQWDGVPMATLMRRALEECNSLDEVRALWTSSPRTCEYFYVFADGKTNEAVGVAATPESIEFVEPGQSHQRLGDGIPDAVLLSSGSRLQTLRARVMERYGHIDADVAKWLMSQPVAMKSNLHNVLFVPTDGVLYVANADYKQPAAQRPYTRLDLNELLQSLDAGLSTNRLK